ncbi:histone-like nucleoid-structuring protein Lsr2 [Brevibacterium oceani]|uniref:histone-like nucleoid-structuring protein Lsr2 n=1 Tax=Brevibacterium oceani TaxID=358099 RepID=UPI002159FCE8|nr:Lsr2 family protein [Brevibacterium oceani]
MAIEKIIKSDISGEMDAATVTFGLGGTWYEIDLTDEEQKELQKRFTDYLKAGRKAQAKPSNRFVPDTTPEEREEIRAWAKENGYELADYGKIPNKIYKAYQEAHSKK